MVRTWVCASLLSVCCVLSMWAQQPTTAATGAIVPQLVNFSGTLTDLNGKPPAGVTGVTFLLYKDEQGGAPLWLETQNVQPDKTGHYSVMLGSTTSTGLPGRSPLAGCAADNNFLRVEGPTAPSTGGLAASFGGYGDFAIDAVAQKKCAHA